MGYLRRTLQALPSGTVLDSAGYAGPGHNIGCEDEPKDPDVAPVHFQTIGDITVPGGADPNTLIKQVGDTWRSWGWYVFEREGFPKPNQFGYAPDGYRLQIEASNPPSYPPTLQGSTPCFPGDIATEDVDYPARLTAEGQVLRSVAARPACERICERNRAERRRPLRHGVTRGTAD